MSCTECDGSGLVKTVLGEFTSFGACVTCQRREMADDYPRLAEEFRTLEKQNEQMKQALKNIRTHYVSVHNEDWKKAYDEIWNMAFIPKEGEQK